MNTSRRGFLAALASLPMFGWLAPKTPTLSRYTTVMSWSDKHGRWESVDGGLPRWLGSLSSPQRVYFSRPFDPEKWTNERLDSMSRYYYTLDKNGRQVKVSRVR